MHSLTNLDINQKQLNILNKANLDCYEKIARLIPKKLFDCTSHLELSPKNDGATGMITGILKNIYTKISSSKIEMTIAFIEDETTHQTLMITWFHTSYPYERYKDSIGNRFLVYGKIVYDKEYDNYKMTSPIIFTDYCSKYEGRLIPAYKKYRGMSAEYFENIIKTASTIDLDESMAKDFRESHWFESLAELSMSLHEPKDYASFSKACKQIDVEDLIYFALHMIKNNTNGKNTPNISKDFIYRRAICNLPFTLTRGQQETLEGLKENIRSGKELNALVQGDVSCGKSIVAYLLMLLFVENGYQTMLLAPTIVLASQHYKDAKLLFEKYGYTVEFINGTLKKKERKELLDKLQSGSVNVLIGTHAAVSDDVVFKNLGLSIVDEEQRFGVTCREKVKTKAKEGTQTVYVAMSATPIPRTLATCLYGEGTGIYSIASMPNGRQSVDTLITDSFKVPNILKNELKAGRQAYVVCALIEDSEENENESEIVSVEKTKSVYEKELPGYKVAVLTGKTKDDETLRIMQDYKDGKIDVIISTTVIEVGVNNPNSSVIVIQNADRFGLSTLHQLRGRVRRGTYKPYCILISQDKENERLKILASTEDGFKLSQLDLDLRKSGNLIGTEQSGKNHFVELVLQKPRFYEYARNVAYELIERGEAEHFLQKMSIFFNDK